MAKRYNKYGRYYMIDIEQYLLDNKLDPKNFSEMLGLTSRAAYNYIYKKKYGIPFKEDKKEWLLSKVSELEKYCKEFDRNN